MNSKLSEIENYNLDVKSIKITDLNIDIQNEIKQSYENDRSELISHEDIRKISLNNS